jgi:hypothetical protein
MRHPLALLFFLPILAGAQSPVCEHIENGTLGPPNQVWLGLHSVLPASSSSPYVWTGDGGSNFYVRLFRGNPTGTFRIRMVIKNKPFENSPWKVACDTGWFEAPKADAGYFRTSSGQSGRNTWSVSVYDEANLQQFPSWPNAAVLNLFRDSDPVMFPPGTASPQSSNSPREGLGARTSGRTANGGPGSSSSRTTPSSSTIDPIEQFLCWLGDGRRRGAAATGLPSPFAGASALLVDITDETEILGSRGREALATHLVQAIELWHRVCFGCDPFNVAVIRLGSHAYMNSVLAEWLPRCTFTGRLRQEPPQFGDLLTCEDSALVLAGRIGTRTPTTSYVPIDLASPVALKLCSAKQNVLVPAFAAMQTALCSERRPSPTANFARLTIEIGGRATKCGDDEDIIACAATDRFLQLNAADYRFVTHGSSVSFGDGETSVDLLRVLIHESGHWLGLRHIENDPGNIMSNRLPDVRCINNTTVRFLNQVVDLNAPGRLQGFGALYFRKQAR